MQYLMNEEHAARGRMTAIQANLGRGHKQGSPLPINFGLVGSACDSNSQHAIFWHSLQASPAERVCWKAQSHVQSAVVSRLHTAPHAEMHSCTQSSHGCLHTEQHCSNKHCLPGDRLLSAMLLLCLGSTAKSLNTMFTLLLCCTTTVDTDATQDNVTA